MALLGILLFTTGAAADDITFTATPGSKNAIFKNTSTINYNIDVINSLKTNEDGKLTYRITTEKGVFVAEDSLKISVKNNDGARYQLSMPAGKPGFYKVSFMINVSDDDDTIRRVFGVDPDKIRSVYSKPADFDQFWDDTKAELAKIPPNFRMTEMKDSDRNNRKVYLIEMQSLDNLTIRAWLTIPVTKSKTRKFPVYLGLPGYQVPLKPSYASDPDIAILYLNVRGQGNSRDVIHTSRTDFITYNIEDKNKYVMRGVIMDCIRAIDFICTRPELDKDKIFVEGGSMGGYLTVATAGLDKRVKLFSAENPILSNIRGLDGVVQWPVNDIKAYVKIHPGLTYDKIMDNMDYFDAKNFATSINSSILVGIGLLDFLAPPNDEYTLYNNIPKDKKIMIFENLSHEVGNDYVSYQFHWLHDSFALF